VLCSFPSRSLKWRNYWQAEDGKTESEVREREETKKKQGNEMKKEREIYKKQGEEN